MSAIEVGFWLFVSGTGLLAIAFVVYIFVDTQPICLAIPKMDDVVFWLCVSGIGLLVISCAVDIFVDIQLHLSMGVE